MISATERNQFNRRILQTMREDLLGAGPAHASLMGEMPQNTYAAGNLSPQDPNANRRDDFRVTEYSPSSLGLIVHVNESAGGTARLHGSINVYYPTRPSLQQLRAHAARSETELPAGLNWDTPAPEHITLLQRIAFRYQPLYVRRTAAYDVQLDVARLVLDDEYHEIDDATTALRQQLDAIAQEAADPATAVPLNNRNKAPDTLGCVVLASQDSLDQALHDHTRLAAFGTAEGAAWRAGLLYRARRDAEGFIELEILVANLLPEAAAARQARIMDAFLFHPQLHVELDDAAARPILLDDIQVRNYRNDPYAPGTGVNGDLTFNREGGRLTISVDPLPVYEQRRYESRQLAEYATNPDGTPGEGSPTFAQLAEDPLSHLDRVLGEMRSYAEQWSRSFDQYVQQGKLVASSRPAFDDARRGFLDETRRYEEGIQALRSNLQLLAAFRLMNQSFQRHGRIKSWRLFQLIFIVTNMKDLLHRTDQRQHEPEPVPVVLWYPTGGGKTEAYVGLALAHAFWDRLRGKYFGITGWSKFPLRLLSMQQLERVVHAVAFADMVRAEAPELEGKRGDPFSVGLYAGGSNSSNFLDWPNEADRPTQLSNEMQVTGGALTSLLRKNHKVDLCPKCTKDGRGHRGQITTTADARRPGFTHRCADCGYVVPLHVSDTEVHRWLPTLVIGTIDKLAALGREQSTRILFGFARRKCDLHGYVVADGPSCNVLNCGRPTRDVTDCVDPGPTLLIQDELHFLRDTLGAFDSHYETMTLAIQEEARAVLGTRLKGPWKILGSTATIEGYEAQIEEVYARKGAVRFPQQGPTRFDSFYQEPASMPDGSPETQRYVLGFRPHNLSHVDSVMKALLRWHRLTLPLANADESAWTRLGPPFSLWTPAERSDFMEFYRTSLTYGLTKPEVAQVNKSFVEQLNARLRMENLPLFDASRVENLTGETDSNDVAEVLHELEEPDPQEWIQAVTATSIISHGVDLEILNFMVFRGQPHTISEYIQSMSRVGRKAGFPSIVVNVYNPNRERDATYYQHHKKYLDHAYSLIRSIPVTRFSRSALRLTAPGLFLNSVMYFAGTDIRWYYRSQLARAMPRIRHRVEDLLRRYYALPAAGTGSAKQERLRLSLHQAVESILQRLDSQGASDNTKEVLDPMTSLRDVDVQISVQPHPDYRPDRFGGRS